MIRATIIFLAIIVIIPSVSNGQWGAAGIAAVIAVVLLMMGSEERKDTKAWQNCRDYWAEGGPNRKK